MGDCVRWLAGVLILLAACAAQAESWPRFRGPNGDGVGKAEIPAAWTESDYRWKIKLPAGGHGSPTVWARKLFILSGDEGARVLSCIDTNSGVTIWKHDFPSQKHPMHRFNSYASSTPALEEDRIYVPFGTPEKITMAALDHSGKVLWETDLGPFRGGQGFGASPVVHGDLIYMTNEQEGGPSSLIALDKTTGKKAWEISRATTRGTYSTPCIFQPADKPAELILTNWEIGVSGIDAATGRTNWQVNPFGPKAQRAIGSPITWGELIIGTCAFTASPKNLVVIRPASVRQDGKLETAWKLTDAIVPHIPSPLVADGRLYLWGDDGVISCLDPATGRKFFSQRLENIPTRYFSSPVCAGDKIFGISEFGLVVAIAAKDTFEQLAINDLDELCRSTPAIANGDMYVRTFEHLYCVKGRRTVTSR